MKRLGLFLACGLAAAPVLRGDEALVASAIESMRKAATYFREEVSTNGGYLWRYKSDFTMRMGEVAASPTTIWVEPPGTPAVGMAFMDAFEATGDAYFLESAVAAARALVWGQLASGGWDYRIDFDPEQSSQWHYRRDVEKGDTVTGRRRNVSTLDDDVTQSALRLLMRVDQALGFSDAPIAEAVRYGLEALLEVQYPNGAWPQRYEAPADPADHPVMPARYPETWSREHQGVNYRSFYTFNDDSISDAIETMLIAHKTYRDDRFLQAALRGGDFMILAQMPEPQPAWAQQYNFDMEPVWARRFEPPAVTGGESQGVLQSLLDLYVVTGERRFLEPVPRALDWAERSRLPDGRLARFYELQTNRPLYFTMDYELTYDDSDMPTHYNFKVRNDWPRAIRSHYDRILREGREALLAERDRRDVPEAAEVKAVIGALDARGRWLEPGRIRDARDPSRWYDVEIIACATFNRNLSLLADYVRSRR